MGDFAENFTFVMQDEVQSYHWNNAQATIHPLVCYWLENGVSKHVACVAVSECLTHDTITVHLFQHLLKFIEEMFRFNKIAIPNNKFQMASGQGSHWLIESPTILLYF